MTLLVEVRSESGPALESIEVDVSTPRPDFDAAGRQLAAKMSGYVADRLGCWLNLDR